MKTYKPSSEAQRYIVQAIRNHQRQDKWRKRLEAAHAQKYLIEVKEQQAITSGWMPE